ncbi:MAG: anthranilate synthase component [Pseudonocardiales bacterium]|nr:anthranilate synthase component [Pseudonocardiales bacterium]
MDRRTYHSAVTAVDAPATPPRIGLTTYRETAAWGVWNEPADLLPVNYADAIAAAGAVALLLPPAAFHDLRVAADAVLDGLHGLALAGGADVDPSRYDAARDAHTGSARPDRDAWEITLTRAALDRGMPVLAICRGMQVLNVALGGDLLQHLPDIVGHDAHCPVIGRHGRHEVQLARESLVGTLLGEQAMVATYHHQGVDRLGTGLAATGWAADGTVEALEGVGAAWVVGVQWHPEVHDGRPLFAGFVAASDRYRAGLSSAGN